MGLILKHILPFTSIVWFFLLLHDQGYQRSQNFEIIYPYVHNNNLLNWLQLIGHSHLANKCGFFQPMHTPAVNIPVSPYFGVILR